MKRITKSMLLGVGIALVASGVYGAPVTKIDLGKQEYNANCASCHGLAGKGDGPTAGYLTKAPTDLSTLAKKNGGVLPVSRLYEAIDGERLPPGHGSRDMPTWGWDYRIRAAEYYGDTQYDPNVFVQTRILALIEYIQRLQAK